MLPPRLRCSSTAIQSWRMGQPDHMIGGGSACLGSNTYIVWKSPFLLVSLLRHWIWRQWVYLSRPEDLLGYLYNKSQKLFFQTRRTRMWMQSALIWRGGILMAKVIWIDWILRIMMGQCSVWPFLMLLILFHRNTPSTTYLEVYKKDQKCLQNPLSLVHLLLHC